MACSLIVFGGSTIVHRSVCVWAMLCSLQRLAWGHVALESRSYCPFPHPLANGVQTSCLVRVSWGSAKANPLPFYRPSFLRRVIEFVPPLVCILHYKRNEGVSYQFDMSTKYMIHTCLVLLLTSYNSLELSQSPKQILVLCVRK